MVGLLAEYLGIHSNKDPDISVVSNGRKPKLKPCLESTRPAVSPAVKPSVCVMSSQSMRQDYRFNFFHRSAAETVELLLGFSRPG